MHVKNMRRRKKKMFKDPVLIDTDGQIDSFWGLVLAKRYLDVKAVTVCGGKNIILKMHSKMYRVL